jgi:hypothetical protein
MIDAADELNSHPERRCVDQKAENRISYLKYYRDIVLAGLFHTWERRLHAVSKDVVRPFGGGSTGSSPMVLNPGPLPEQLLPTGPQAVRTASSSSTFLSHLISYVPSRRGCATGALSFPSALHTPLSRKQHGARCSRAGDQAFGPRRIPAACRACAPQECRRRRAHRPLPPAEPLRMSALRLPSLPSREGPRN